MPVLGLCNKVETYVAHMFCAWRFSLDTWVQIDIKGTIIFFPLIQISLYLLGGLVITIDIELNNQIN